LADRLGAATRASLLQPRYQLGQLIFKVSALLAGALEAPCKEMYYYLASVARVLDIALARLWLLSYLRDIKEDTRQRQFVLNEMEPPLL